MLRFANGRELPQTKNEHIKINVKLVIDVVLNFYYGIYNYKLIQYYKIEINYKFNKNAVLKYRLYIQY